MSVHSYQVDQYYKTEYSCMLVFSTACGSNPVISVQHRALFAFLLLSVEEASKYFEA